MPSVQNCKPSVSLPVRSRTGPGPWDLPGIEGFYVLSASGNLGRYDADGQFSEEEELTEAMEARVDALLRQYRTGNVGDLAIGLVTASITDRPWRSASLVFSDTVLRKVFKSGNDPDTHFTAFQKRNKVKSVFQGMGLILDAKKPSQSQYPRFCPVLFAPEVDRKTLCRRYGLDSVVSGSTLEVLDLLARSASEGQQQPAVSMVIEMRRAGISPELRRPSGLMLVEDTPPDAQPRSNRPFRVGIHSQASPWEDAPESRDTCFNDGDPVAYWLMAWFAPFDKLNDLQRQFIARGYTIIKKRAGATLIERGSRDDVSIYLVEGTLELKAFDGRETTIVGGTRRARFPISQLRPHAYTVKAATDVTVILISQVMLREITRITTMYRNRPVIELTEEVLLPENPKEFTFAS